VPEFTLLPGPKPTILILIWAAFVGCVDDRQDCCAWLVVTRVEGNNCDGFGYWVFYLKCFPQPKTMFSSGSFWSGKGYFLQGLEAATVALRFRFQLDRNRDAMMTVYKLHLKQAAVLILQTPHSYGEYLGLTTNVSKYGMAG
jgi:hypothetical protein